MNKTLVFIILFSVLLVSCAKELKKTEIEWEAWKLDKYACNDYRVNTQQQLQKALPIIEKMTEYEILKTLGQPDASELLRRSQKEFTYYLDPGPDCPNPNSNPTTLWIRFGAIGNVSEVLILKD